MNSADISAANRYLMLGEKSREIARQNVLGPSFLPGSRNTESDELNRSHYDALPSTNSIRVIDIQSGTSTDPISLSMYHVSDYRDAPSYHALSYCWGYDARKIEISCNGKSFFITLNLYAALRQLRSKYGRCRMWIDAICINQCDVSERNQQVSIMRQIYTGAVQVDVWLGQGDEIIADAVSAIESLAMECCASMYGPKSRSQWAEELQREDDLGTAISRCSALHRPNTARPLWKSITHYYTQPWFSRVWVIQEVQASRLIWVLCGETRIEWQFVALVGQWAENQLHKTALSPQTFLRGISQVQIIRARFNSRRDVPFLHVLEFARNSSSSDARDKVFAMLQHSVNSRLNTDDQPVFLPTPGSTHLQLRPDYNKTTSQVYTEVALCSIRETGSLEALDYVHLVQAPDIDLPSWVPRWDLSTSRTPHPIPSTVYNASLDRKACISFISSTKLVLRGVRIDSIAHTFNAMPIGGRNKTSSALPLGPDAKLGTDWLMALSQIVVWDTTTARTGQFSNEERAGEDLGNHFADFASFTMRSLGGSSRNMFIPLHRYWCSGCSELISSSVHASIDQPGRWTCSACDCDLCSDCYGGGTRLCHRGHELEHSSITALQYMLDTDDVDRLERVGLAANAAEFGKTLDEFGRTLRSRTWLKTFFSTAAGWVGQSPFGTQASDIVVVFFGGRTPYTLRENDGTYQLLGPCYVFGMMDGEAVEMCEDGTRTEEEFEIR